MAYMKEKSRIARNITREFCIRSIKKRTRVYTKIVRSPDQGNHLIHYVNHRPHLLDHQFPSRIHLLILLTSQPLRTTNLSLPVLSPEPQIFPFQSALLFLQNHSLLLQPPNGLILLAILLLQLPNFLPQRADAQHAKKMNEN